MSRRNNPVSTYLSDEEKQDLAAFVDGVDDSQSEVVRNAILEYIDHDRYARIESEVREINEKLDRALSVSQEGAHTHTSGPTRATDTVEKVRRIAKRLHQNHEPPIPAADVNRAIEDIAGADDRTKEKYRDLLKQRELLFEHPSDSAVWTDTRETWVQWVNDYVDATPSADVGDFLDEYGLSWDDYDRVLTAIDQ